MLACSQSAFLFPVLLIFSHYLVNYESISCITVLNGYCADHKMIRCIYVCRVSFTRE